MHNQNQLPSLSDVQKQLRCRGCAACCYTKPKEAETNTIASAIVNHIPGIYAISLCEVLSPIRERLILLFNK